MPLVTRLVATLGVVGLGWGVALLLGIQEIDSSSGYFVLATVLLAIGLFSSTYEIAIEDVKGDVRVILVAITLGVLAKAALIAGAMYVFFEDNPAYIVLGVAVAQIDPLSVAVMRHRSRLSTRAKTILSAWSSFDDPVTAILAIYLSAVALNLDTRNIAAPFSNSQTPEVVSALSQLSDFGSSLLANLLLVVVAGVLWLLLSRIGKRMGRSISGGARPQSRGLQTAGILALAAIAAVAVGKFLMLGLAAVGLFFRPGIERFISAVTPIAFMVATAVLGLVIVDGVRLVPGLVLGCAAFVAQFIVGIAITHSLPFSDRFRLALGQQSGITAVILALLLETMLPGTVAIVAPAILVINILHLISNTLFDKIEERRSTGHATNLKPLIDATAPEEKENADNGSSPEPVRLLDPAETPGAAPVSDSSSSTSPKS